ncbi:hypothetical protein [uncultured Maritalea sp.]|nr:hypothetical protein [uncultured Maritalea sp.]
MVVVADQKNTREVKGLARVVDGDSLQIDGQKIRVIGKFISWFNLIRQ